MHYLLSIKVGLIFIASITSINSLPRIDPIAYHQSVFKYTTQGPKQHVVENVVSKSKSNPLPLQSIMRFFDNMSFMKNLGQMFEKPKQRLQAAPKVQQPHAIDIKQVAGQALQQNDEPIGEQFSIDEPSQSKDQEGIGNFEWKHLLLGPSGLLTSIFNEFKERHKMEIGKVKPNIAQADLTPEQNDFAKLFESFLQKAKNGNFDEPLPELPFIGICNRVNCGDIYKAVDEFRKSEFFSNFQTAISLLHDPKGLDIIGQVLANPELIENFVGKNAGGSLPQIISGNKTLKKAAKDELTGEYGDFGVDFSAIEDGKQIEGVKKVEKTVPVISANLDYYSSVDSNVEKEEKIPDHIDVEEEITTPKVQKVSKTIPSSIPMLPEISESIDAVPQEYEVAVEETIPTPKQIDTIKINSTISTTTQQPKVTTTTMFKIITPPLHTTTKRNFRVKDPYYAIYYDENS